MRLRVVATGNRRNMLRYLDLRLKVKGLTTGRQSGQHLVLTATGQIDERPC